MNRASKAADQGDLHLHTNFSDGCLSPSDVVQRVLDSGMAFFSITDHNSLGALRGAGAALPADGPEFILGVEVSAQPDPEYELHLLGYGFDETDAGLQGLCRRVRQAKGKQLRAIVRSLRHVGIYVDEQRLMAGEDESYVGRPVLAELLVRQGVVNTTNQAFALYLRAGAPTYVPMEHVRPEDGIEAIHGAGGLAVLAHPTIDTVDRWIKPLADMGLDGVEVYRPGIAGNEQLYVEKAAEQFGMFVTGGSDAHGRSHEDQPGSYVVSRAVLEDFFAALDLPGN